MISQATRVTDQTFDGQVRRAEGLVLVDFWATWCGPCRMVDKVLEAIAADHPSITLVTVNVDENPRVAAALHILGVPTVQLWSDGAVLAEVRGARPKSGYLSAFEQYLS